MNTPYTYCDENNKWMPVGFAPSEPKMSGSQHRHRQDEKQNQISKRKSEPDPVERKNISRSIENTPNNYRADEHRVIEWIRECQEPTVDLMDDVPKLPGQSTLNFLMVESTSTSTAPLENLLQFPIEEDHHVLQIPKSNIRARRHSATSSIGNDPFLKF